MVVAAGNNADISNDTRQQYNDLKRGNEICNSVEDAAKSRDEVQLNELLKKQRHWALKAMPVLSMVLP